MSARLVAATAVAACVFVFAPAAFAADLYEPSQHGSAYDDPRYADIYGDREPAPERYGQPPADFEPPYAPPRAPYRDNAYRETRDDPRYAEGPGRCIPRDMVRERLHADGWGDFHEFEPRGSVVLVEARRPSGRLFDLTIDRCSGEIVQARPLEPRALGPFAFGARHVYPRPY